MNGKVPGKAVLVITLEKMPVAYLRLGYQSGNTNLRPFPPGAIQSYWCWVLEYLGHIQEIFCCYSNHPRIKWFWANSKLASCQKTKPSRSFVVFFFCLPLFFFFGSPLFCRREFPHFKSYGQFLPFFTLSFYLKTYDLLAKNGRENVFEGIVFESQRFVGGLYQTLGRSDPTGTQRFRSSEKWGQEGPETSQAVDVFFFFFNICFLSYMM